MAEPSVFRGTGPFVCLAAICCLPAAGLAAGPPPGLVRQLLSTDETGALRVAVDPDVHRELADKRHVVVPGFPLPGREPADLDLTAFDVLSRDARFVVVDSSGAREVPRPGFRAFRGRVVGEPDAIVALNLFDGHIAGFVRSRGEEFTIVPRSFAPGGTTDVTIRDASADVDRPDTPMCSADLPRPDAIEIAPGGTSAPGAPAIDGTTPLTAQVAIDATFEWYDHFGDLAAAQNYILNLMAQVSTIYENEVNITIEVPFLRVFTTPADPYNDTTNTTVLLNNLRAEWNANQVSVTRTVAHLFSWRASGGAGLAYLDSLCTNALFPGNAWDYGVSTMSTQGSSWEKSLVAHELGHNFSSPHTHCYAPEIDQCANEQGCYQGPVVQTVGTIMSYCNSFAPLFHQRVEDETIRPAAEAAYPTCISAPAADPPNPPANVTLF